MPQRLYLSSFYCALCIPLPVECIRNLFIRSHRRVGARRLGIALAYFIHLFICAANSIQSSPLSILRCAHARTPDTPALRRALAKRIIDPHFLLPRVSSGAKKRLHLFMCVHCCFFRLVIHTTKDRAGPFPLRNARRLCECTEDVRRTCLNRILFSAPFE